jgi:hypothetical protein
LPGSSLLGMDEDSSRGGGVLFSVQLANALLSDANGKEALMVAVRQLRGELSRKKPPIDSTLHVPGLITRLVSLLGRREDPSLQLEVAWILTNLASGTEKQCAPVLEAGTAKVFVEVRSSPKPPWKYTVTVTGMHCLPPGMHFQVVRSVLRSRELGV